MNPSSTPSPTMLALQTRLIWATRRAGVLQRHRPHFRSGVTVWHLESGSVTLARPGETAEFRAPCWLLMGSGWSSHVFGERSWLTSVSVRIHSYEGPFLRVPWILPIKPGALADDAPGLVRLYRQRLQARTASEDAIFQLKLHAAVAGWSFHLGQLLHRLLPDSFMPRLRHPGLRQAMNWLHDHISEERVNEPDVATAGGMSVSHFKRVFQKELGMPLREYLRRRKVDACIEALLHTDKPIKEIGFDLGFSDPANFVRWFRQHFNLSPGAYRASQATGR